MNILYIAPVVDEEITGGILSRKINYQILKEYSENLYSYTINVKQPKIVKIFSVLFSYKNGLNRFHIKNIIKKIRDEKISVVFCDGSLYGILLKKIYNKYSNICIISFYHNCEYKLYSDCYNNYPALFKYFLLRSVSINEKYTLKYSTINIFFNVRDSELCKEYYNIEKENIFYSPMALNDRYVTSEEDETLGLIIPKKLLFVGSYFPPNINGLLWFDRNVLPYVDYDLVIVGKYFDNEIFTSKLQAHDKIEIMGFIEDIGKEYHNADIVIQPVFEGAGMKTKTAECFMYGKTLVSTSEGLVGYDVNGLENVYRCDLAEEFIEVLNILKTKKIQRFNPPIRKLFVEKYSKESRKEVYFNVLQGIENSI